MSEANLEPPLVTRVESPLSAPPAKPRPGLGEAVLWCILFIGVQLVSVVVVFAIVLGVHAVQAPEPWKFVEDQVKGLADAAEPRQPDAPAGPSMPTEIGQALAYGMLGAQLASLGLILLVFPRRIGRDWTRQLALRTPSAIHVGLVILIVPAFVILPDWVQKFVAWISGMDQLPASEALEGIFTTVPVLVAFLAVSVGPGVVEELWCRGFLGRGLVSRYGFVWGIALTSLLFGFLHIDPAYAMVTACMGAYLHFVYFATRSLWIPILLHLANNGIGILIALSPALTEAAKRMTIDEQGLTPVIGVAALALLLSGSYALWSCRTVVALNTTSEAWLPAERWQPEYPGISRPPATADADVTHGRPNHVAAVLTVLSFAGLIFLLTRM